MLVLRTLFKQFHVFVRFAAGRPGFPVPPLTGSFLPDGLWSAHPFKSFQRTNALPSVGFILFLTSIRQSDPARGSATDPPPHHGLTARRCVQPRFPKNARSSNAPGVDTLVFLPVFVKKDTPVPACRSPPWVSMFP